VRSAGGRRSATPEYSPNAITRNSAVSPAATQAERSRAMNETEQGASADAATPGDPGSISLGQALGLGLSLALGNVPGFAAQIASIQTNNQAIAPSVNALMAKDPITQAIQAAKAVTALLSTDSTANPISVNAPAMSPTAVDPTTNDPLGINPNQQTVSSPQTIAAIQAMLANDAANSSLGASGAVGVGSGGSLGSEGSDSGAVGTGDGSAGFKRGGEVNGPGTGTSDSIPARLSDGEYVIPADVVERLGVGFFDRLRAQFHTPAA